MQQTKDEGFILGGHVTLTANKSASIIFKTNSVADTSWSKTIESSESESIKSIQQTNDDGYIMVGELVSTAT